jgi:RimJ/RimL family protein N-acetyltransferase
MSTPGSPVSLRDVQPDDLPIFYEYEQDPLARHMVAFAPDTYDDRAAFDKRWRKILDNTAVLKQTIVYEGAVAGQILSFEIGGQREVGYWLGRDFWGKGIATRALELMLALETTRPLHARVAKDNLASRRVLEKCGFSICGEDKGFAAARGKEVEEWIMCLEGE